MPMPLQKLLFEAKIKKVQNNSKFNRIHNLFCLPFGKHYRVVAFNVRTPVFYRVMCNRKETRNKVHMNLPVNFFLFLLLCLLQYRFICHILLLTRWNENRIVRFWCYVLTMLSYCFVIVSRHCIYRPFIIQFAFNFD